MGRVENYSRVVEEYDYRTLSGRDDRVILAEQKYGVRKKRDKQKLDKTCAK